VATSSRKTFNTWEEAWEFWNDYGGKLDLMFEGSILTKAKMEWFCLEDSCVVNKVFVNQIKEIC